MDDLTLTTHNGDQTMRQLDALKAVYADAYTDPPYNFGADEVDEFESRLERTIGRDGFTLVTGHVHGKLAGFSYGYQFGPDNWWIGAKADQPTDLASTTKFAVIELVVGHDYRGRGYSRQLLDALITNRTEPVATILANRGAQAHAMYSRWGWNIIGEVQSYPHWPIDDILTIKIPTANLDH